MNLFSANHICGNPYSLKDTSDEVDLLSQGFHFHFQINFVAIGSINILKSMTESRFILMEQNSLFKTFYYVFLPPTKKYFSRILHS